MAVKPELEGTCDAAQNSQPLHDMRCWTGSTGCSHHGIEFSDVIEKAQREEAAAAREISQSFLNLFFWSENLWHISTMKWLVVAGSNNLHLTQAAAQWHQTSAGVSRHAEAASVPSRNAGSLKF